MKVSTPLLSAFLLISSMHVNAQRESVSTDQNPRHMLSQAKYESISDSLNHFHSTTLQNTYEAFDWYDAKQQRKADRTNFRRQLRLEQARNNYGWGYQQYDNRWNNYNGNGWNNNNRYNSGWNNRSGRNPFFLFNNWCW